MSTIQLHTSWFSIKHPYQASPNVTQPLSASQVQVQFKTLNVWLLFFLISKHKIDGQNLKYFMKKLSRIHKGESHVVVTFHISTVKMASNYSYDIKLWHKSFWPILVSKEASRPQQTFWLIQIWLNKWYNETGKNISERFLLYEITGYFSKTLFCKYI